MTTQIVLVPGFRLGAWGWDEVAGLLRERGFDVVALTLPGLDGGPTVGIGLAEHANAIREALDESAGRRILVAHSGAAFPGTLAVDRWPDLIDRVVMVDTAPPGNGTAFNAEQVGDFSLEGAWDGLAEEGSLRDLSEEQLAELRARAVPQPAGTVTEHLTLTNEARTRVPMTVICTAFSSHEYRHAAEAGVPYFTGLLEYGIDYVDLPTGHWPMWSKPVELAEEIAAAAE